MRVNNNEIPKSSTEQLLKPGADNAGKGKVGISNEVTVQSGNHASVSLSSRAQEIGRFAEAAIASPELGAERVSQLRLAINSGSYKIDHEQLAVDLLTQSSHG